MTELRFTAKDIPSDIADLLHQAAQAGDTAAWQVGRLTNALIDDLVSEGVEFSKMSLYKAIAAHAHCASETVRMRAHVERHFPKKLLKQHEWLSFHQAKALVPLKDPAEIEKQLEEWQEHSAETLISVTSVDGLRAWLHQKDGSPSPGLLRYRRLVLAARKLADTEGVPDPMRTLVLSFLGKLSDAAKKHNLPEWEPEVL